MRASGSILRPWGSELVRSAPSGAGFGRLGVAIHAATALLVAFACVVAFVVEATASSVAVASPTLTAAGVSATPTPSAACGFARGVTWSPSAVGLGGAGRTVPGSHDAAPFAYDGVRRFVAGSGRGRSPAGNQVSGVQAATRAAGVVVAAEDGGMAAVRAAGRSGEDLAGILKNTRRIESATGTARYRIPDELGDSVLGEVKNVSSLSYTSQLQDFLAYARANSLQFKLYVRGSTEFSSPLQDLVDSGAISRVNSLGP